MKFSAVLRCKHCKGKNITLQKIFEAENRKIGIECETLLHDGYGWDLNTFDFFCFDCGESEEEINVMEVPG